MTSRHYDRALAPVGLTSNGYAIVSRLDQEGQLALGALAARLAMDRTTLSREIAPLIVSGLVEAAADEHDARRRLLSVSASGARLARKARPFWAKAQAELTDGFGVERTAELLGELHALLGAGA